MRNAYVVIKDMIDLIPQSEEERFQILKHNLSTHILGSWAHAAPEKQYSQWPWSTAKYYLELTICSKRILESSRRDINDAILCTVL